MFDGFVMRATCIDPRNAFLDGCADFQFFKDWDPEFIEMQNNPYPKVRIVYCS